MRPRFVVAGLTLWALAAAVAHADVAVLTPSKDNTLYQDGTGGISNGAGIHFYVGQAGSIRRGLLAFDVAGNIPAGSTVLSATLDLYCSRLPFFNPPDVNVTLHRLSADWGEGASDAGDPGGTGAPALPGDATWIHTFFPASLWATAGGDYVAAPSASLGVGGVGLYTVASSPALVADVQSWLDGPTTNFGWILLGEEGAGLNARRFETREHPDPAMWPVLRVEYVTSTVGVSSQPWATVKALFR